MYRDAEAGELFLSPHPPIIICVYPHIQVGSMLGNASAMKPLVKSSKWRELKYARFFYEERCAQGGAKVLHAYWDEIKKAGLNKEEMKEDIKKGKRQDRSCQISIHNLL